jgi:hypothetical protein
MAVLLKWLREHKFEAHLVIFLLMIIPSMGLYLAAQEDLGSLIWALIGVFSLANLLAMGIK